MIYGIGELMYGLRAAENYPLSETDSLKCFLASDVFNTLAELSRLGCPCSLISVIGNDQIGSWLLKECRREGVRLDYLSFSAEKNCLMFQYESGLSSVSSEYYRKPSPLAKLQSDLPIPFQAGDILYLTSYSLTINREARQAIIGYARNCRASGGIVIADPNLRLKAAPIDSYRRSLEELLPDIDYFLPSHDELLKLSLSPERLINEYGIKEICIKDGQKPVQLYRKGSHNQYPVTPVSGETYPLGCGDAFNAGFIYSLLSSRSADEAIRIACACAQSVIHHFHPYKTFFQDANELESYLSDTFRER